MWVLLAFLPLNVGQVYSLDLSGFLPNFQLQRPTLGYRESEDYTCP